jgi:hypothetical protein
MLFESDVFHLFRDGYSKYSSGLLARLPDVEQPERFPFLFLRHLQQRIFLYLTERRPMETTRDVLDAYMTSYFNAWLDNQNLYRRKKRIVTAFTPRLSMSKESVEGFFETYPDGTLLTMLRNPVSWYASALRHNQAEYEDLDQALDLWIASARSSADAKRARQERVIVVPYEDLVLRTKKVMKRLAARVGIDFLPTLLEPTFNGFRIRADSAFRVPEFGIIKDPLDRGKQELDPAVVRRIEERAGSLYKEVARLAR